MKIKTSKPKVEDTAWQDEEDVSDGPRWRFYAVPGIVLVIVLALGFLIQSGQEAEGASTAITFAGKVNTPAPKVGAAAPDFTLVGLNGKPVSLSSFKGKVVLLNFFATWCPPCRAEMPDLEATYKELKDQGFEIVAVDLQEDSNTVSGYARSLGLDFTILLDRDAEAVSLYHVNGLPTTFFIDRNGTIQDLAIGALNKKSIRQRLDKLLQ